MNELYKLKARFKICDITTELNEPVVLHHDNRSLIVMKPVCSSTDLLLSPDTWDRVTSAARGQKNIRQNLLYFTTSVSMKCVDKTFLFGFLCKQLHSEQRSRGRGADSPPGPRTEELPFHI